ncbi:MAG TPA: HEAT repeat domain-containing protein [Planctomycetota bacterium]|nr:HEAT repeat domain-containing protein [Planctomycetota bacterium]
MIPAVVLLSMLLLQPADGADALIEKLRSDDAGVRRQGQLELLQKGAAAVPPLIRALESASPRPEQEIAAIVARLSSASWKERNEATEALVRLGRTAVPALEAKIAGADAEAGWRLRSAAAEIKEKAGQDEQSDELRAAAVCDVLAQTGDARAVAPLLRLLAADPPSKRTALKLRACQALGLLRPSMEAAQAEEAADRVLQVLERAPGPLEKGILIKTLGRLKVDGAVRPLAALLADRSEKNVHLKRSCITALAAIGRPRGVRALADALAADEVYIRQGAAAALEPLAGGDFGYDPRATPEENRDALAKFRAWGASTYGKAWDE